MKKIFTLFSAAFMMIAVDAQTTMTLSQTNDDTFPEQTVTVNACMDNTNAMTRVFDLTDYGITGNFIATEVDAAAVFQPNSSAEVTIWNLPGWTEFPDHIPLEDFIPTDYYFYYGNTSPGANQVWGWVTFDDFSDDQTPLTPDTQFAVVITGEISNEDVGFAGSVIPLYTEAIDGYTKSSFFGGPTTGCYADTAGFVSRMDVINEADMGGTHLSITGEVEGLGLISLDSRALSVYPNPATDVLNIDLGSNKVAESIEIVNLTGQSVMKSKAVEALDVSSLAPGVYIVRVKDADNVTHMTRIVKK